MPKWLPKKTDFGQSPALPAKTENIPFPAFLVPSASIATQNPVRLNMLRERLLDPSQIQTDRWIWSSRIHKQVDMFGHKNKPDQFDRRFTAGSINAPCQFLPSCVVGQQWHPTVARKGQFVQMANFVKMPNRFSMCHVLPLSRTSWNVNPPRHWQSQWHSNSAYFISATRRCLLKNPPRSIPLQRYFETSPF